MAIGNTHKTHGEDRMCSSKNVIAEKQTHKHTHTVITILRFPIRGGVKCCFTTEQTVCWHSQCHMFIVTIKIHLNGQSLHTIRRSSISKNMK